MADRRRFGRNRTLIVSFPHICYADHFIMY